MGSASFWQIALKHTPILRGATKTNDEVTHTKKKENGRTRSVTSPQTELDPTNRYKEKLRIKKLGPVSAPDLSLNGYHRF